MRPRAVPLTRLGRNVGPAGSDRYGRRRVGSASTSAPLALAEVDADAPELAAGDLEERRAGRRVALLRGAIGVDRHQLHRHRGAAPRAGRHVDQLRGGLAGGFGVDAPGAPLLGGADPRRQGAHAVGAAKRRRAALIGRRARQVQPIGRVERGQGVVRVGRVGDGVPALEPELHQRLRARRRRAAAGRLTPVRRFRSTNTATRHGTHDHLGKNSSALALEQPHPGRSPGGRIRANGARPRYIFAACAPSPPPPSSRCSRWARSLTAQAPRARHNKVIALLEQKQPVFGLYAPSNRRPGGPPGTAAASRRAGRAGEVPAASSPARRPPTSSATSSSTARWKSTSTRPSRSSSSSRRAWPRPASLARTPSLHLTHPMIVKAPEIAPDPAVAAANIGKQLNQGVSGVMLVTVETADEARQGIAAMRFTSKGGTRPEGDVGTAPAVWGMSEAEYRRQGRSVAAQSRRRAHQLDHRREQEGPGEPARDRRRARHRRAVARRRHAARRVHDHVGHRRAHVRSGRLGSRDPAGAGGVQGVNGSRADSRPTPPTSRRA